MPSRPGKTSLLATRAPMAKPSPRRPQLLRRYFECHPREMKRDKWLCAIVGSMLACCITAAAQDKGVWLAASSTTKSITGDITLSAEKISINFSVFVMARIRDLKPDEMSAAFDAESGGGGSGGLYRLSIPASKKFLHRNTLCGAEDTQWMATYVAGNSLHLAFFSGEKEPALTLDTIANSTDLCGIFSYVRAR